MSDPFTDGNNNGKAPDSVTDRYVYTDESETPLYRVCRTSSKNFFFERFESDAYIPGLNGARKVLYNLPEVIKAKAVFLIEGEKDCETLRSLGLVATTNAGGADSWNDVYAESFKGKRVAIIPDNDEPGRKHAWKAAKSILPVAETIRLVELPDLPEKGDVTDYLKTHSKEDLLNLVRGVNLLTVSDIEEKSKTEQAAADANQSAKHNFTLMSVKELLTTEDKEELWIWDGILPANGMILFVAKPKVGKTTMALNLSIAVAQGIFFLNRPTTQGPVVYLALEENKLQVKKKLKTLGVIEDLPLKLHFGSAPINAIKEVEPLIIDTGAKLLVIDLLQKFCRVRDLNDYAQVTTALEPILAASRKQNCHVILTHHAGKADRPDE